ncbi:undecaprenyl-diphosphate phosphatase [bacterium]|nr:undecaprenyl-diphosphate phosphatase [bacterium]
MPPLHAIILGIVQGLTELFPISSSAHLYILPVVFLNWEYQSLSFDVALHLGTLVGLVAFLYKDWKDILKGAFKGDRYYQELLLLIIIACVPGALFGALLEKQAETIFRTPTLTALTLSSFAILLWLADRFGKAERDIKEIKWKDAILIGLSQALAIIPGVSRSGATMTTGLALGLKKEESARFSFLIATPIIAGAALWEGREIITSGLREPLPLLLGFLSAAVSSYFAVYFLLRYLRKRNFLPFVIYRFLFAFLILIVIIFKT